MHFHSSTTAVNLEEPKRSKRERFRAKAEEFLHIKHHQGDGAVSQPEKYSTNDTDELVKKAQELLTKKNDGHNDNNDPKKDIAAALGAMGPVAYEMWKKKKEKKKEKKRRERRNNTNYDDNDNDNVDWEVEEEVEEEEEEKEEEEGSSGFGEFLSWIQEAFAE